MSWWIGLNRSEFSAQVQTREFSERNRYPKKSEEVKEVEKKKNNINRVRQQQLIYRSKGLCESCGKKTELNPNTNKQYMHCEVHREKRKIYQRTYKIRKKNK